jgi:hypothetical protein
MELTLQSEPTAAGASLVAERLTYMPGTTIAVRRHTQVRVISLEAGALEVQVDGVAFRNRLWPAGSLLAEEPHRVEGVFHLQPSDLLAIPTETAFTVRNTTEHQAVSLEVSVQLPLPLTPMTDRTGGTAETEDIHRERLVAAIATAPGEPADVFLGRLILSPGRPLSIDAPAGSTLFIVERGILGDARDSSGVERVPREVHLVSSGKQATIRTNGDDPLVAVLVAVSPSGAIASG